MSGQPFLPLFFGDFLASTAEWTGEERGLYLTLLGHQWSLGSLPANPEKIRRIVQWERATFDACWPIVAEKFREEGGRLTNARLEVHRERAAKIAEKNAANGAKGAASRWGRNGDRHEVGHSESMATAMHNDGDRHEVGIPDGNGIQTNPKKKEEAGANAPTAPPRKPRKPEQTTIPDGFPNFAQDLDLASYVSRKLPAVDLAAFAESFRAKALAKGWTYANWRAAVQEFARNGAPDSGHWAAGQYPKTATGGIQWQ